MTGKWNFLCETWQGHNWFYLFIFLKSNVMLDQFQICTTLCVHSLYSYWRDEKSVVRSLQELSQNQVLIIIKIHFWLIKQPKKLNLPNWTFKSSSKNNNVHALHSNGLLVDFEKAPSPSRANLSFYNAGFHGSQHQGGQSALLWPNGLVRSSLTNRQFSLREG